MSEPQRYQWYHKVMALISAVVIMELGIFLIVYPWFDEWSKSFFAYMNPAWDRIWQSAYFRGAVSGIGFVNVYIAFHEVLRLRRFSTPQPDSLPPPAGPSPD